MRIEPGVYTQKELFSLLNISTYTQKHRKEELLEHFKDFFKYTVEVGGYHNITISYIIEEVYADYEPLPRKGQRAEKEADYKTFTLDTIEKHPLNTTMNIARRAVNDKQLQDKWHHKERAAANYIGPVINSKLVSKKEKYWCRLDKENNVYEPLTEEQYNYFKGLINNISSTGGLDTMAEVVSLYNEGEISQDEYQNLISNVVTLEFQFVFSDFKSKYGFIPVKVSQLEVNKNQE